jgi:hypothetical protein
MKSSTGTENQPDHQKESPNEKTDVPPSTTVTHPVDDFTKLMQGIEESTKKGKKKHSFKPELQ